MAASTSTQLILQHAQDYFQEEMEEEKINQLITQYLAGLAHQPAQHIRINCMRAEGAERLLNEYFWLHLSYNELQLKHRFCMSKPLFLNIFIELCDDNNSRIQNSVSDSPLLFILTNRKLLMLFS